MPVIAHTGARVAPGDALFSAAVAAASSLSPDDVVDEAEVVPGEGCVVHFVEEPAASDNEQPRSRVHRCIVATRQGVAQWDGRLVSVFAAATAAPAPAIYTARDGDALSTSGGSSLVSSKGAVMGPRPGDTVHVRVTRLNRLFAFGEIIAVNWRWCSHRSSAAAGPSGVFKGVLRQEDIRPFRPTKDQLQPPAPTLAFGLGDVVLAEVISQSDAHQYQLSTIGENFGVVESYVSTSEEQYHAREKVKLQHIPGRRDAMMVPSTGGVVPRWCPLLS